MSDGHRTFKVGPEESLSCGHHVSLCVEPGGLGTGAICELCAAEAQLLTAKEARCKSCGYTEDDAKLHMDHRFCSNAGNAPWEKRADRDLVRDYDADGVQIKQRFTVRELEAQLLTAKRELDECRATKLCHKCHNKSTLQSELATAKETIAGLEKRAEIEWQALQLQRDQLRAELATAKETIARLRSEECAVITRLTATVAQQVTEIQQLRDEIDFAKQLESSTLPCGHHYRNAVTTDGGKTGHCVRCEQATTISELLHCLRHRGSHAPGCSRGPNVPCDCGLDSALAQLPKETPTQISNLT